jgi:aminodeoxyfutalosine synthase
MSVDAISTMPVAVIASARAGRRLETADVTALAGVTDILSLGALADEARRARHGATTWFLRVHELDTATPDRWMAPPPGAREVRLTGRPGAPPVVIDLVQRAKALADGLVLRGFTLSDLVAIGGAPLLAELRAAGLDDVALVEPGADAVAQVTAARDAGLGVKVIGAVACPEDRAAWLLAARALQEAVGGFEAVAPLSQEADATTPTTGFDDVRQVALARLALETVPHVQVDWRRHGPKLAQVALTMGADDIDLVAADDDTSRGSRRAPLEEIRRNITAAGLVPVERDGRFASLAG